MLIDVLSKNHNVTINNITTKKTFINKLFLGFFDITSSFKLIKDVKKYDLVWIEDIKLLPLCIFAKLLGKKVIFEEQDYNPSLLFYFLTKKYSVLKYFKVIVYVVSALEQIIARIFTDKIVVNSKFLKSHFYKSKLIFYASALEGITNNINNKKIGFLYIGCFCKLKGADEILNFMKNHKEPLFIFGEIPELDILKEVKSNNNIYFTERLPGYFLKKLLKVILQDYFLYGFSLTKGVCKNYRTTELSKEADYLALGIPIIGNDRGTTADKIEAGCGMYLKDFIIPSQELKELMSNICKNIYNRKYSSEIFKQKINNLINN
jgi:glycosyltransferase involved in cell wall biosynthesis